MWNPDFSDRNFDHGDIGDEEGCPESIKPRAASCALDFSWNGIRLSLEMPGRLLHVELDKDCMSVLVKDNTGERMDHEIWLSCL
jgi:hypothetical protein